MALNADAMRVLAQLRSDLARVTDAQTRELVGAWARAWDEVSTDLSDALLDLTADAVDGRVSRAAMLRSERLARSLTVIGERLSELAQQAGVRIVGDLPGLVRQAVDAHAGTVLAQLPAGTAGVTIRFGRVDADTIAAIVERSTEQITALTKPLSRDATQVMKRELMRGIAVGDNPRETARRMVARAEGRFNGGLGRALTISRTETLDAMREAGRVQNVANGDVLKGWVWIAELSSRTCPACLSMHGSEHPVADPGPLGHQNCRCARAPVTKSWADLGFAGLDEPPSLLPDAGEWFGGLLAADQRSILGPARHDAWSAGRFPMDSWSTRRSTPGWRDSYVVAAPPKAPSARLAS